MLLLSFWSIEQGHSGTKYNAYIWNISKPVNTQSWKCHTETMSEYKEKKMDLNLKLEAPNEKFCLDKTWCISLPGCY